MLKIVKKHFSKYSSLQNLFHSRINLESKNLSLIPLETSHNQELLKILNFHDLWTYNPRFNCKTESDIEEYLNFSLFQKQNEERYPFIIYSKEKEKLAGTTSFYNISLKNKTLSLGYTIITPEFQKTGLNKESKKLMLDWCFREMDFVRLDFHIDKLNEKSFNSLKKFGAIEEGILRSNIITKSGRRRDTVVLSILRDEWNNKI